MKKQKRRMTASNHSESRTNPDLSLGGEAMTPIECVDGSETVRVEGRNQRGRSCHRPKNSLTYSGPHSGVATESERMRLECKC